MKTNHPCFRHVKRHWFLIFWVLALVGYFSPWIFRQPFSAATNWNAYDLYDAVLLLPEIETGAISVKLQTLRTPLLGLAGLLALHLAGSSYLSRVGGALLGCALAFITLPPYPIILTAWRTPGWRVPFWWALGTGAFCIAAVWLLPRLSRFVPWLALLTAAFIALPAASTLNRLLPALHNLHAAPVGRGWGFWMTEFGVLGYTVCFWLGGIFAGKGLLLKNDMPNGDSATGDIDLAFRTAQAVKARYQSQLLAKPNVVSVGIGRRTGGTDPVIIVSVTQKVPLAELSDRGRVPQSLDGITVQVEEIGVPYSQKPL